jgi:hypothetical protein
LRELSLEGGYQQR